MRRRANRQRAEGVFVRYSALERTTVERAAALLDESLTRFVGRAGLDRARRLIQRQRASAAPTLQEASR